MNEYMTNNEQVRERMKGGSEGKNGRREERGGGSRERESRGKLIKR